MENKCNKTPNSNNKYLDHVYCHPSDGKNYIRANNNNAGNGGGGATAAGADLLALLKENKQLKAMLLLHLDLIQAQSDQLLAKDKQLGAQNADLETVRSRNAQLETQVQDLQKQLQRQIKRSAVSPPPLAKIQRKSEPAIGLKLTTATLATANGSVPGSGVRNVIGECNGKLISKIILHRVNLPERSPNSTTASDTTSEADDSASVSKTPHERGDNTEHDDDDYEVEEGADNTTEDSNDAIAATHSQRLRRRATPTLTVARGAKPLRSLRPLISAPVTTTAAPTTTQTVASPQASAKPTMVGTGTGVGAVAGGVANVQVCVTPPTPSRGKQMPLMLWHAPELHSDESASCDSMAETDQRSTTGTSPASLKLSGEMKKEPGDIKHTPTHTHSHQHAKSRRCAYISTSHMYCTREWEDDEFLCDYEFIKEEANALHADAPMLEIPKWTEHELTVSYCIEGTEDLSDETFLKRHTKLEVDEKRRKKWDVQQIREQRRIEKLKRRHCKDEIQVSPEQQPLLSFYPQADAIQTICFVSDLPVQAFGEVVPKPNLSGDFALPWMEATGTGTSTGTTAGLGNGSVATLTRGSLSTLTAQAQQQLLNSTFVFLKKRKRQQSSSNGTGATARQRTARVAAPTTTTTTTTTHTTTSTTLATAPVASTSASSEATK